MTNEKSAAPAQASDTESVLIDGVAYDVPAAVAGELLSLHLDLRAAAPAQAQDDRAAFKAYLQGCDDCAIVADVAGAFNAGWTAATRAPAQAVAVPVDPSARNVDGRHPKDDEPRTDACIAALDARGDDRGQGLDGYWKWGFAAGFNAATATPAQEHATQLAGQGQEDESAAFEEWARGLGFAAKKTLPTDGAYSDSSSHIMWEAWQARARRAAPIQEDDAREPYSIDADPEGIRARVADAITGALAFGAQGSNTPPPDHWLAPFWMAARFDAAQLNALRELMNAQPAAAAPIQAQEDARDLEAQALRACRDLPMGWDIVIHLEKGSGSVVLIDPEFNENDLPVDASLFDALKESIDQAVQADAARAAQGDRNV